MGNYEAALRAHIIALRGRMNCLAEYSYDDAERREWNLCSSQVDALDAELKRIVDGGQV